MFSPSLSLYIYIYIQRERENIQVYVNSVCTYGLHMFTTVGSYMLRAVTT